MAFGVLLAAAELGIAVPEQLSVVGIDDHDWSAAHGLTTVRQDPREQGALAARIVFAELDGDEPPDAALHPTGTLIVRRSTARPAPR